MTFAEFIAGRKQAEVAADLNVTQPTVSRWVRGEQTPSAEQALEIEKWSGGKLKAHDLNDTIRKARQSTRQSPSQSERQAA